MSLFNGYDVERADMTLFSDLMDAVDALDSDSRSLDDKLFGFAGAIAAFFGLPVKNVYRDIKGLWQTIADGISGGKETSGYGIWDAIKSGMGIDTGVYDDVFSDMRAGKRIDAAVERLVSSGRSFDDDIKPAIKKRVREWYQNTAKDGRSRISKDQARSMLTKYARLNSDEASGLVEQWTCYVVTGIDYGNIKAAFQNGEITASRAKELLTRYGGYSSEEAEQKVAAYLFQANNPDQSDLSDEAIAKYNAIVKPSGVSEADYYSVKQFATSASADVDDSGKAISGSKREKVLDYINEMNLTVKQKDALYRALGYAESTLKDVPWK